MSTGILTNQMIRILADMMVVAFELQTVRREMGNVDLSPGDRMIWAGKEAELLALLKKMGKFLREVDTKIYNIRHPPPPPPPPEPTSSKE